MVTGPLKPGACDPRICLLEPPSTIPWYECPELPPDTSMVSPFALAAYAAANVLYESFGVYDASLNALVGLFAAPLESALTYLVAAIASAGHNVYTKIATMQISTRFVFISLTHTPSKMFMLNLKQLF